MSELAKDTILPEGMNVDAYYNTILVGQSLENKRVLVMILNELTNAELKHGDPWAHSKGEFSPLYAAAIVGEEAGELLQASMQLKYENKSTEVKCLTEAAQTGATAIRYIKNTIRNQNKKNV